MKKNKKLAIIAGVCVDNDPQFHARMSELAGLAAANNLKVVLTITQNLPHRIAATYFGSGKLTEIKNELTLKDVNILVVNDELSPTQIRNLEKFLKVKVIDHTELILEIFENRARTNEAKIQVAIAKLQYEMPRIHPSESQLDQQGGGSGLHNRGSGETQSEINRRTILKQINELKARLKKIKAVYETQKKDRLKSGIPRVALVGYTNAGKSTTFNNLPTALNAKEKAASNVLAADQLFATLDTTIKFVKLPNNQQFLISDTVGFISNLPHQLIESFQTTLQEAKDADLLINVVDYADPNCDEMLITTKKVLKEIGASEIPMITFYNKADLLLENSGLIVKDQAIFGSALSTYTLQALGKLIIHNLFKDFQQFKLLIPFSQGKVSSQILKNYPIISCDYCKEGTKIIAKLSPIASKQLKQFIIS